MGSQTMKLMHTMVTTYIIPNIKRLIIITYKTMKTETKRKKK